MSTDVRILEPGQLEAPRGEIRFLFLPDGTIFSRRAERLRLLSNGHPLGDFLSFLAKLSNAQQEALQQFPRGIIPGPDEQARCREKGMPLLGAQSLRRDPAWRSGLKQILQTVQGPDLPALAQDALMKLMQADEGLLEGTADCIVSGYLDAVAPQEMPFVAAALQVYWVRMASLLKEDAVCRSEQRGLCPVCGSPPSVGIVRSTGSEQGLRYLSCSLCASQWHLVRLTCSACQSTEGIDYYTREGSNSAVKAESCVKCGSYMKLLYLSKDPHMDPTADDLATVSLDMLMDEEGRSRRGPNLYYHPGRVHGHD
ncbi:MAG TPA: formate dehydrogenase accessory protein FdhE [Nitrospirota bacterium]|nr:formate dehydrogenase accessory protein FdhE [Nitrospirota bacterium]